MAQSTLHLGFIGLGIMGRPMALNLHAAGHRLYVHNRSRAVVDELAARGMRACATPAEGARMPATRLNLELYQQLVDRGWGDLDHSALIKLLG